MGAFQDRGGRGVAVEGGNASAKLPTSSQNDVVLPRYRLMLSKGACPWRKWEVDFTGVEECYQFATDGRPRRRLVEARPKSVRPGRGGLVHSVHCVKRLPLCEWRHERPLRNSHLACVELLDPLGLEGRAPSAVSGLASSAVSGRPFCRRARSPWPRQLQSL
jgi:hypothetical protein